MKTNDEFLLTFCFFRFFLQNCFKRSYFFLILIIEKAFNNFDDDDAGLAEEINVQSFAQIRLCKQKQN